MAFLVIYFFFYISPLHLYFKSVNFSRFLPCRCRCSKVSPSGRNGDLVWSACAQPGLEFLSRMHVRSQEWSSCLECTRISRTGVREWLAKTRVPMGGQDLSSCLEWLDKTGVLVWNGWPRLEFVRTEVQG